MNWTDIINAYGFPIMCVCCLGWYVNKLTQDFRQTVEKLTATHSDEVNGLREAIEKLAEKIK